MNPWTLKLKTQQSNDHENDEFRLQLGVEVEITSCRQDQNMLASEENICYLYNVRIRPSVI